MPDDIPVDSHPNYRYTEDDAASLMGNTSVTLASTPFDFKFEHGRRYHAYREGSHPFPNDDLNADHEKIAHHMFLTLFSDRLYEAPIQHPKNILDIGTGIGLWAEGVAEAHPDARVLGVDLTPPAPSVIPNLEFRVDDVTQSWTPDMRFDFIHMRLLFGAIQDWPALYHQCYE